MGSWSGHCGRNDRHGWWMGSWSGHCGRNDRYGWWIGSWSAHCGRNDRHAWWIGSWREYVHRWSDVVYTISCGTAHERGFIQRHASPGLLVSYNDCNGTEGQKIREVEQPVCGKERQVLVGPYSDTRT